ncbi:PaaI family thioesterase [Nocardia jinanensis]|uniref:Esterase n=1 Tax=Nocardia jinanensis TaxID=382504 RepID=A0A917RV74_9NOCA|nr:PaaI family thioesterase [Nocardia jinanensis]GGL31406.1 putative esterase [Nocardia jinanensis]
MPRSIDVSSVRATPEDLTELNAKGFDGVVGLRLTEVSPDRVRGEWAVEPLLHQATGVLHGGVHCAVIESLASTAGWTWLNRAGGPGGVALGVHNSTDFIRATTAGTLSAEATPVHRGRQQQIWQVTVSDDQQRLIARGQVRLQNVGVGA